MLSVEIALGEIGVGVYPAIPQEGPVGAARVHLGKVALGNQDLFSGASLYDHPASRIGDKAATPELDSGVRCSLEADPVHRADVDSIGNGVASLDGFPRRLLLRAMLLLFGR